VGDSREHVVEIGEVVEGRYKILELLGEGGMGTVFLAEHWLIKRRVAMKFLHRELVTDADMIRRFMNEALAAGTLGHPNIAESTDMGFTRTDIPYIVFEYIDGRSLSDEIARLGGLPVRRALKIAYQIASALETAHKAGIVHRDLKTENIILTERDGHLDHVKVLDFGISRFLAASDRTALGATTMGTPEFMAPEQITSPDSVDQRADIYALGVVVFEMLTGRVPFAFVGTPGDLTATHALLHQIINTPPPLLERADAPLGLPEMLAEKLLAKDPANRFASMTEVRGGLEAFASEPRRSGSMPAVSSKPFDDAEHVEALSDQTMSRATLSADEIAREVKQLGKRWSLVDGCLQLELFSRSMTRLAEAIQHTATIADEVDNHPRVALDFPRLTVTIRPDKGAITVLELVVAARIEQWLLANRW
jgi:serine/threonine-protein kinase